MRRRSWHGMAAIAYTLLAASTCSAQDNTSGNFWLKVCASDPPEVHLCSAFLLGVDEFNRLPPAMGQPREFCPPQQTTMAQHGAVVVKFMRDHPGELHHSFVMLALAALKETWPRPAKSSSFSR
jgi:Rap1a immunity proteins